MWQRCHEKSRSKTRRGQGSCTGPAEGEMAPRVTCARRTLGNPIARVRSRRVEALRISYAKAGSAPRRGLDFEHGGSVSRRKGGGANDAYQALDEEVVE